jgi:hypothetical protein
MAEFDSAPGRTAWLMELDQLKVANGYEVIQIDIDTLYVKVTGDCSPTHGHFRQ